MNNSREHLRERLLDDAYVDRVDLRRVDWQARRHNPVAPPERWRDDVIEVIQSLVEDGFVEVGHPTLDGGFIALPLADCLRHLYEVYVAHYDEPYIWGRCTWLNLTAEGRTFVDGTHQRGRLTLLEGGGARRRTNGRTRR